MENNNSFIFYRSFFESIKDLDQQTRLQVYDAICEYALNDEEAETDQIAKAIMVLIKPQIDANKDRRMNGKQGGRPRKNEEIKPMVIEKEKNKKPMVIEKEKNKKPNVNVNDNVNVNANVNDNDNANDNDNKESLELLEALKDFENMRKKIKRPLTAEAKKRIINKLNSLTDDDATKIAILNQSVDNCWLGVFELKTNNVIGKSKDVDALPIYDDQANPEIDNNRLDELLRRRS